MLGREATIPFEVVARCPPGHPLVIRNAVRTPEGEPFPTRYWLVCPDAVHAVSRLESAGWVATLSQRARDDAGFGRSLEAAHRAYAEERGAEDPEAGAWGGVGGTSTGVKCLHAHLAYHLAGGDDTVGAWTAAHLEPYHDAPAREPVAAVDLGTNSIRLLVAVPGEGGPADLARDMVITRIGQGVDRTGRLDPEALERTLRVLERYVRRARALGARRIGVAATSAVRDADNRHGLAGAVERLTGSALRVLSGDEEARLSYLGAVRTLHVEAPVLVMDIGGGSTEFVVGRDDAEAAHSTDMGSVRLTERHVAHDPPTPDELRSLGEEIDRFLSEVEGAVPVREARTFVGVAGTATTVAALALDLDTYDPDLIHGRTISLSEARQVLDRLAAITTAERAALPAMAPGREDVIATGALILVRVMERFGFDRAVVSEHDILDGLALELAGTGP